VIEFRLRGQDDVVHYVVADAADPLVVQSLFPASFSRDGDYVIGNCAMIIISYTLGIKDPE